MTAIKKLPEVAKTKLNGEAPKTPVTAPEIPAIKKELLLLTEGKRESPSISLEDKIYRIQMLGDLIDQREKLAASLKKLQSFKNVSDNFLDKITLRDSNDNVFTTSNNDILQKCIAVIKESIQNKLQEVEAQITF